MKSPEKVEDVKKEVQDKLDNGNGGDDVGGGGRDKPPLPPKVASTSKSEALRKLQLQREKDIPRGFLIPFPLHRCGWSPEAGTKRWCILNLVLIGIAIIVSLANVILVMSTNHSPENHKLFMAFHPGVYWKCHKVLLTMDVASTCAGEMVYLIACIFLLLSVLSKETNMKILLAKFYLYISILYPVGYLPRLFLLSSAPCKDPNVAINFGLIIVLFSMYLLLLIWLVVGNRLVRSYILWLRNPNAEEFFRDDDSEQIEIEEGNKPRQFVRLSNLKNERNIFELIIDRKRGVKSKASASPIHVSNQSKSAKSSKAAVTSVPLNFKQSHTSLIEEIPSINSTRQRPLDLKEEAGTDNKKEENEKKKKGILGKIMGGLKNMAKKK